MLLQMTRMWSSSILYVCFVIYFGKVTSSVEYYQISKSPGGFVKANC